jgi:hypothetical protein
MNQALSFGLLAGGGILFTKALTGNSWSQIFQGHAGAVSKTPGSLAAAAGTSGVAGVGTAAAGAFSAVAGAAAKVGGSLTGQVNTIAAGKGWGASEVTAWLQVISRESGGNPTAKNPSSGAYGIAQFINGPGEYAQYGGDVNTVAGQLTAMANYIHQRYGTPSAAWAHEQQFGWY